MPTTESGALSRRQFLLASAAAVVPLAVGCSAAATAPPSATGAPAASAASGPLPSYLPSSGGATPDYHSTDSRVTDGFEHFPKNAVKSWTKAPPGSGSHVDVFIPAYYPTPTPYEQNPTWQAINKQLNADLQMNIIGQGDYQVKMATLMAGNELPDIIHMFGGIIAAPALPEFLKAKCADLTPYLGGDAIKDYPNLSAIPTYAWKNSQCAIDGKLYMWPIQRYLPGLTYFFKNTDIYDKEIGANYVPKDADDFLRVLRQLNQPQNNRWAIGDVAAAPFNFGLGGFAAMFGAPNIWGRDANGKLLRDRETEQYKAAVGYVRNLWSEGLIWANAPTATASRPDFAAGHFALSVEGFGNSWNDFWRQGLQQNPPQHFDLVEPFSATAGAPPVSYLTGGYISTNAMKQASPDRIRELLRIVDWLAAPFGSQEDMLLSFGLEGNDYTLDANGDPKFTQAGTSRAGYVPWRYIAQHPYVQYQPDLPGYSKRSFDAEQLLVREGMNSAVQGYYSKTEFSAAGGGANRAFSDGINDIVSSRRPLEDYDQLVADWRSAVGETIRGEYMAAMAGAA